MTKSYRQFTLRVKSQYCDWIKQLTSLREGWQKGIPAATKPQDLLYIDIFNKLLINTNVCLVMGN